MAKVTTLTPEEQAISADLQKQIEFSEEKMTVEGDSTVYFDHAEKAGLTKEVVTNVKNYDKSFMAAEMDAVATVGLKAVQANAALIDKKFEATFAGVKGEEFSVTYTPKREGVMKGAEGTPDKPWTSYGSVSGAHKSVTKTKGGSMGAAMDMAAAAAEAVLAGSK